MTLLLSLAATALLGLSLNAQTTLLQYGFDGDSLDPTTEAANITGGTFDHANSATTATFFFYTGSTLGASQPAANVAGNNQENWASNDTDPNLTRYYTFTLTVDSGSVNLDEVSFAWNHSTNGPKSWQLRSDLDGDNFTTVLGTNTVSSADTNTVETIVLSSAFDDFSGTVEFRIYGYGAVQNTSGQGFRIDDVTVSAIPEPGTFAMLAGLSSLMWVMVLRRKK